MDAQAPNDDTTSIVTKDGMNEQVDNVTVIDGNAVSSRLGNACNENMRAVSPSIVSVTLVKPSADVKLGISLKLDTEGDIIVASIDPEGMLMLGGAKTTTTTSESDDSLPPLLVVGDKVKSIQNNEAGLCEASKYSLRAVQQQLEGCMGVVTLTVERPQGRAHVLQASVIKPNPQSMVGIGFDYYNNDESSFLEIKTNGLFGQSCLQKGDILLSINNNTDLPSTPMDALELIRSQPTLVTILAMRLKSSDHQDEDSSGKIEGGWRKSAKQVGVGLGGGVMVIAGLVVTPLPTPFGELLVVGGVALLATEFDTPKRVVKSARDSLMKLCENEEQCETAVVEEKPAIETKDEKPTEPTMEDENSDEHASTDTQPTMKHRLKRFGSSVVVPILSQIVGDEAVNGTAEAAEREFVDSEEPQE